MNRYIALLAALTLTFSRTAHAAERYFQGFLFEASISSSLPCSEEKISDNASLIRVREGQEYSIIVRNPLPVRVAAAVTVDGLNSIDGKRSTADEAQKWIIEPYSSITISGWQTSDSHSRKFFFTNDRSSYSTWKGKRDGRDYSPNLGVVGVAFFWNSAELRAALYPPQPFMEQGLSAESRYRSAAPSGASAGAMNDLAAKMERAGTGMGNSQWNPVTRVNFSYDTGMYSAYDALTIRYEFGPRDPRPLPFEDPATSYRYPGNYAPQM